MENLIPMGNSLSTVAEMTVIASSEPNRAEGADTLATKHAASSSSARRDVALDVNDLSANVIFPESKCVP